MDVDLKAELKKVDKNQVKSFLMFDHLMLPTLVKLLYALGSVIILLAGLAYPFWHAQSFSMTEKGFHTGFDVGRFLVGILISVVMTTLWLLALRILSEAMVCLYEIHGQLVPKRPKVEVMPPSEPKTDVSPAPPALPAPPST